MIFLFKMLVTFLRQNPKLLMKYFILILEEFEDILHYALLNKLYIVLKNKLDMFKVSLFKLKNQVLAIRCHITYIISIMICSRRGALDTTLYDKVCQ